MPTPLDVGDRPVPPGSEITNAGHAASEPGTSSEIDAPTPGRTGYGSFQMATEDGETNTATAPYPCQVTLREDQDHHVVEEDPPILAGQDSVEYGSEIINADNAVSEPGPSSEIDAPNSIRTGYGSFQMATEDGELNPATTPYPRQATLREDQDHHITEEDRPNRSGQDSVLCQVHEDKSMELALFPFAEAPGVANSQESSLPQTSEVQVPPPVNNLNLGSQDSDTSRTIPQQKEQSGLNSSRVLLGSQHFGNSSEADRYVELVTTQQNNPNNYCHLTGMRDQPLAGSEVETQLGDLSPVSSSLLSARKMSTPGIDLSPLHPPSFYEPRYRSSSTLIHLAGQTGHGLYEEKEKELHSVPHESVMGLSPLHPPSFYDPISYAGENGYGAYETTEKRLYSAYEFGESIERFQIQVAPCSSQLNDDPGRGYRPEAQGTVDCKDTVASTSREYSKEAFETDNFRPPVCRTNTETMSSGMEVRFEIRGEAAKEKSNELSDLDEIRPLGGDSTRKVNVESGTTPDSSSGCSVGESLDIMQEQYGNRPLQNKRLPYPRIPGRRVQSTTHANISHCQRQLSTRNSSKTSKITLDRSSERSDSIYRKPTTTPTAAHATPELERDIERGEHEIKVGGCVKTSNDMLPSNSEHAVALKSIDGSDFGLGFKGMDRMAFNDEPVQATDSDDEHPGVRQSGVASSSQAHDTEGFYNGTGRSKTSFSTESDNESSNCHDSYGEPLSPTEDKIFNGEKGSNKSISGSDGFEGMLFDLLREFEGTESNDSTSEEGASCDEDDVPSSSEELEQLQTSSGTSSSARGSEGQTDGLSHDEAATGGYNTIYWKQTFGGIHGSITRPEIETGIHHALPISSEELELSNTIHVTVRGSFFVGDAPDSSHVPEEGDSVNITSSHKEYRGEEEISQIPQRQTENQNSQKQSVTSFEEMREASEELSQTVLVSNSVRVVETSKHSDDKLADYSTPENARLEEQMEEGIQGEQETHALLKLPADLEHGSGFIEAASDNPESPNLDGIAEISGEADIFHEVVASGKKVKEDVQLFEEVPEVQRRENERSSFRNFWRLFSGRHKRHTEKLGTTFTSRRIFRDCSSSRKYHWRACWTFSSCTGNCAPNFNQCWGHT